MAKELLPQTFRKSSPFSYSYSWTDTLQGQGYILYYPTICTTSAAGDASTTLTYSLNTSKIDSGTSYTSLSYGTNNAAYQAAKDMDFDLAVQYPAVIGGSSNVNVTISGTSDTVGQPCYMYVKINVYHVSTAAVETLLGTADSVRCTGTNGSEKYHRLAIPVTLVTKNFVSGEKLRVNIIWYMKSANGVANASGYIYCDPSNNSTYTDTDGRTIGSDIIITMPFKIDL